MRMIAGAAEAAPQTCGASTVTTVTAGAPNRLWALDFQFDATEDGRPVEIVSIVDEHTRGCLGGSVERSITAEMKSPDSPGRFTLVFADVSDRQRCGRSSSAMLLCQAACNTAGFVDASTG